MNPIHSFTDHPSLKSERATTIYLLDLQFYYAHEDDLHRIELTKLRYTNMGEPFRQLARLEFKLTATQRSESIDISIADAAKLFVHCQQTERPISVEPELASIFG